MSRPAALYALLVLLLAYILSFVDRNVMAVLVGPIREDFAISDFQYSLLHGFAFSMFYIFMGLPIARDMRGKVIGALRNRRDPVRYVETFESAPQNDVLRPEGWPIRKDR